MHHTMKGMLSYLILWILKDKSMNGSEIAAELKKRKGTKPNPGTIYPALKELKEKKLVLTNKEKKYTLTKKGEKELEKHCAMFCKVFYDMHDMFKCCKHKC